MLYSPLFHFLLVGFIIFITSRYVARRRDSHKIIIDKSVVEKLIASWQTQFGKIPTDRELKIATDDYVRQEVLYREGQSMGLEQEDEIIKRRLQQKMAFILKDNIVVPDPSQAELDIYYKKNADRFADPPSVSFSHIYFSKDKVGAEQAKEKAKTTMRYLAANPTIRRGSELGDRFMLLYDYGDLNKKDAIGLFGDSPFTDSLFTVNENQWKGPFLSGYGYHLLFVNKKSGTSTLPLNQIKDRVIESYKSDKLQELDNEAIEKLIEKYTIEIKTN